MGKASILNRHQKIIIGEVGKRDFLRSHFYFTGGTALSEIYLRHRESLDLDFFSEVKYDPQTIFTLVAEWSKKYKFVFESQLVEPTHIYFLDFGRGVKLKVDFAYYPFKRLREGKSYMGVAVDSKFDIAVNKLLLVSSQRVEVKDFVDLYYLLHEFSLRDLIEGVRKKFNTRIDPFVLASDFTAVEGFEFLPKMIKPFSLEELRGFFEEQAKKLGKKAVK